MDKRQKILIVDDAEFKCYSSGRYYKEKKQFL